tara:strand:- start:135 stop:2132 length:1998 start_codon:yes stop_codon:yes gene_type:complete
MAQGEAAMSFIQTFAQRTPFDIQTLSKAFIQLGGAGIAPTEQLLTTFGDAAAATTNRVAAFEAMVRIATRSVGGGLGLEELEQLQTQGIPVYTILQEEIGKTRLELSELGQTAEGAHQIMQALQRGLDKRFGGGMQKASQNLSVSMSNLGIAMTNLKLALGEGVGGLGLTKAFTFLTNTLQQFAVILKPVVHLLGTVLAAAVVTVTLPFRALSETILFLGRQLVALARFVADAFPEFEMLDKAVRALEGDLDSLSDTMNKNIKGAGEAPKKFEDFDNVIKGLDNDLIKAKLSFLGYEDALIDTLEAAGLLEKIELPDKLNQTGKNARMASAAFEDQADQIVALLAEIMNFDQANQRLSDFNSTVESLEQQLANLTSVGLTGDDEQGIVARLIGGKGFTKEQIEAIRKLVSQIEELKERQKSASEAQAAANERKEDAIDIINDLTVNETKLEEQQRLLTAAIEEFGEDALPNAKEALEKIQEEMKKANPLYQEQLAAVQDMSSGISDAFADMVQSGKLNFESLADAFSNFTKRMISKAIELMFINRIMNSVFNLTGDDALKTIPIPGVKGSAGGGSISGPTLVGERGPELFVPSSAGSIKNNMDTRNILGGGSSAVIHQTINIETGVSQTVRAEMQSLLPAIRDHTLAAVVDQRKRGGTLASAFGA